MIKTINECTNVIFAEDLNNAKIVISVEATTVVLQEVAIEGLKVGIDNPTKEQTKALPKVDLSFTNKESIDLLIAALELAKNNLQSANYRYALAC